MADMTVVQMALMLGALKVECLADKKDVVMAAKSVVLTAVWKAVAKVEKSAGWTAVKLVEK